MQSFRPRLYVALIHYPVQNKNGDTIASAITNLDLHDIARTVRTYGVRAFYVVTPLEDQIVLAKRIVGHWRTGYGATYNPDRRDALAQIRIRETYAEVLAEIAEDEGIPPKTVITSAKPCGRMIGFAEMKAALAAEKTPFLLNFGTAWGLSPEFAADADMRLPPIEGCGEYNHLSVRCAAAIILDRLLGDRLLGDRLLGRC